jgi:selenocysteine lyase/cysteine desulfurase
MNKRDFLRRAGQAALAFPFTWKAWAASQPTPDGPEVFPADFWENIRQDYDLKPEYINLESGYYNIIPRPTLEKYIEKIKEVNYQGAYYMRTVQWDNKKRVAARLATYVGCSSEELILTRNTTESLDMIISGYPWKKGDEAVYAEQDYGAMQMQFQQVARRYGVVNKVVSLPLHPSSDDEIVSLYESAIGPRTRLLMICHMVNITGQILPVRKICDMAHRHGVEVLIDGAHCIGHFQVDISTLDCDYYGSSLHKWLAAPLGAGMLFVKKRHIHKIWPLLAEHHREADDIERLNHTGTHPVHTDLAIDAALDYIENMGLKRKEERLRYLQRYWTTPLRSNSGVLINTPEDPNRSCAIANVGVRNLKPATLARRLQDEFGIFTVAIDGAGVHGCRITPNVFTRTTELDRLIEAVEKLAS